MDILLKKADKLESIGDIAIITIKENLYNPEILNEKELEHLKKLVEKGDTFISFNQYNRYVFYIIADKEKDTNVVAEEMRKNGYKIQATIADNTSGTIEIVDIAEKKELSIAVIEGILLGSYKFIKYFKNSEEKKTKLKNVSIISNTLTNEDIEEQKYIAVSIYKVRDLINEPVNHLNAEDLGNAIYEMCTQVGCEVEVFNKNKIEALKMGGLLAVNQGSVDAPSFTIVEWKPANATNSKPIVLVGKGVVYDSGGLSLKPTSDSMDYMKSDMSGAAVTAGVMYAIAANKIPVYVIGLIPATDNRPSGNAYAPGDVITMMDGTNVEMLNSDAEGRMILADALTYSKRYEPQLTITVATLTGSAAAAIGSYGLVAMGNAPKEIKAKLIESAERTYERMVEFPFWDEYAQDIKSDIAELKNVGGKLGGAITAGKFLEYFAPPSFMHFDIAGVAFSKKNDNYRGKGGTGFGLRLLYDFIKRY